MKLNKKVAFITGAGGPMGQALAQKFYDKGVALILTDISNNRLLETVELLGSKGKGEIYYSRANALDFEEVKQVVKGGIDLFNKVDILINVVGGIRSSQMEQSILEIDNMRWQETMELNLMAGINCIKLLAPQMIENKYGKIVNISSINYEGEAGYSDYSAAKAAVTSMTRTTAIELSPYINVNCIAPGVIKTSVLERLGEEKLNYYKNRTLLKRLGRPEDIANTAYFLTSDDSAYITGEIISVSGGIWPHL